MQPSTIPPGPKEFPLLGHALEMLKDPLDFMLQASRQYGDVVKFSLPGYPIYLFNHPDHIEEVLRHKNQFFIKDSLTRDGSLIVGNGLLTSEGDFWKKQRRLAQPAFHHERINSYAEVMVRYTERAISQWREGQTRDIHQDMMRLTLDIVSKTLFGVETQVASDEIGWALDIIMERFHSFAIFIPPSLPTPGNLRLRKALKKLDEIVYGIIRQRRESKEDTGDLLSMLLAATSEEGGMDDKQLRDESVTLLLAGHETTALTLSYAWYLLAQHPTIEAKLQEEISQVLGERAATAADVPRLRYAEAIIRESMRLYPPAWGIGREAIAPCEIGGYPIKKGLQIWLSQWVVHRDPRYFPEPEAFRPERWENDLAKRLPRYAFFPFGGGPRICIGNAFAMMESVLLLVTIARRFRVTLSQQKPLQLLPSITLRPKNGVRVSLHRQPKQN